LLLWISTGFPIVDEAKEFLSLVNRHWNTIAATLYKSEIYVPLLLEDEHGEAYQDGNRSMPWLAMTWSLDG
jgi:hypothetical protein